MGDTIKKILELAVWAPSGDNSQPWKFNVKGNKLQIFNLPGKDLPFYNFEQKGSLVAHGALIENISIIAPHYGYAAETVLMSDSSNPDLTAEIIFKEAQPADSSLLASIPKRCTNRKAYKNLVLTQEQKDKIGSATGSFPEAKMIFAESADAKRKIGAASAENELVVLETHELHESFFNHVVWSEAEEIEKKSGLYYKTMELAKPKELIFRLARKWSTMQRLNKWFKISKLIAKDNARLYASGGASVAVVMEKNRTIDFLKTGRIIQRAWLSATQAGLALHPMTGILFLMQRVFANKAEMLGAKKIEQVRNAYNQIAEALGVRSGYITFLFRVGHAPPPSAHRSRLTPIITFED